MEKINQPLCSLPAQSLLHHFCEQRMRKLGAGEIRTDGPDLLDG
jgi:hypothetical protein